jgi:hypothetical protein
MTTSLCHTDSSFSCLILILSSLPNFASSFHFSKAFFFFIMDRFYFLLLSACVSVFVESFQGAEEQGVFHQAGQGMACPTLFTTVSLSAPSHTETRQRETLCHLDHRVPRPKNSMDRKSAVYCFYNLYILPYRSFKEL